MQSSRSPFIVLSVNRNLKTASKVLLAFVFLVFTVTFDQVSKYAASKYFTLWCNEGGIFGFGTGVGSNLLISLASVGILIYFIYLVFQQGKYRENFAFILVLSGGLSNFVDRLAYGCVRDFIQIFKWFPAFNLADVFISLGVLYLIFSTIKNLKKS